MEMKNMFSLKEEKKKRAINIGTAVVMDGVKTNKTDLVDAFAQGLKTQVEPQSHTSSEQNLMYKEGSVPSSATTQFDSQDMEDIASHIGARNINVLITERTRDEPKRFARLFKRMCKILDVNIQRVFETIHTPKIWNEAKKFTKSLIASLDRIDTRFMGWFERKVDSIGRKKTNIAVGLAAIMLLATPLSPLYAPSKQFIADICTLLPPGMTVQSSDFPHWVQNFLSTDKGSQPSFEEVQEKYNNMQMEQQRKQEDRPKMVEQRSESLMLEGQTDELVGRAMLALSQTTDTETYFKQALPILALQNHSDAICAMGILHRPNDITLQRFALGSEETPTQEDVDSFLQAQIQNCPIVARFADMASPNYVRKLSAETFDKNRGEISTEMFCGYSDEISF